MYFVISKTNKQFFAQTFPNTTPWNSLLTEIKGEQTVELFQNDKLEKIHFEEYFNANYKR